MIKHSRCNYIHIPKRDIKLGECTFDHTKIKIPQVYPQHISIQLCDFIFCHDLDP